MQLTIPANLPGRPDSGIVIFAQKLIMEPTMLDAARRAVALAGGK